MKLWNIFFIEDLLRWSLHKGLTYIKALPRIGHSLVNILFRVERAMRLLFTDYTYYMLCQGLIIVCTHNDL